MSENEPWKDKELMFRLYYEKDYTYAELADRFGCNRSTAHRWMQKHQADRIRDSLDVEVPGEGGYKDAELMRTLYHDEELSTPKIAAVLNCSTGSVTNWLKKHGIQTRSPEEAISNSRTLDENDVPFWTHNTKGHEFVKVDDDLLTVHRLQAVAYWGFEKVCEKHVHHINGIHWDNREENLQLVTNEEHQTLHRRIGWLDRIRLAELYENGDASSYVIADAVDIDVSSATVRKIHQEFYGEAA